MDPADLRIFEAVARLGGMNQPAAELVARLAKETAEAVERLAPAR